MTDERRHYPLGGSGVLYEVGDLAGQVDKPASRSLHRQE
jgi:hypothetical protein